MKIETVSKTSNLAVIVMILVFLAIPTLMIMTNSNLKNSSPSRFLAVQIEGEPKIREVYVQDRPTENPEAMKSWVKTAVIKVFNYDANNYIDVMKASQTDFTKEFYPDLFKMATQIKDNVQQGFYITSSVVDLEPVLVQQAVIDGNSYYKFYMRIVTYNKSELKTIMRTTKLFVTVKFENPEQNVRGIAISSLTLAN